MSVRCIIKACFGSLVPHFFFLWTLRCFNELLRDNLSLSVLIWASLFCASFLLVKPSLFWDWLAIGKTIDIRERPIVVVVVLYGVLDRIFLVLLQEGLSRFAGIFDFYKTFWAFDPSSNLTVNLFALQEVYPFSLWLWNRCSCFWPLAGVHPLKKDCRQQLLSAVWTVTTKSDFSTKSIQGLRRGLCAVMLKGSPT